MQKMSIEQFEEFLSEGNSSYEDCGMSGKYIGYHWYIVTDDQTGQTEDFYVL